MAKKPKKEDEIEIIEDSKGEDLTETYKLDDLTFKHFKNGIIQVLYKESVIAVGTDKKQLINSLFR